MNADPYEQVELYIIGFAGGACPRTPLIDSRLPTLNAHYRRPFFVSKLQGEHICNRTSLTNSQLFRIVVAMYTKTYFQAVLP